MQALVDIQIQRVDCSVPVEVCVDIVVGVPHARAMGLLVQVQVKGVGAAVVVEIAVTQITVTVDIAINLARIADQQSIVSVV